MREQNYKKGFTLIEVIVVMSIISILSLIGIGAFLAARDDAMINADADQIISRIRDYQNRSMAVVQGDPTLANPTQAWGLQLDNVNNHIDAFWVGDTPYTQTARDNDDISLNSTLSYSSCPGGTCTLLGSASPIFLFYGTPFAKTMATTDTYGCFSGGGCVWAKSGLYPKNSFITSTSDIMQSGANPSLSTIEINLSYKGRTKQIIVRSNGDASIQ